MTTAGVLILACVLATAATFVSALARRIRLFCRGINSDLSAFGNEWLTTELLRMSKQCLLAWMYFDAIAGSVKTGLAVVSVLMALTSFKSLLFQIRMTRRMERR